MLRKLLIRVWIGPLPAWLPQWTEHMRTARRDGFDYLLCNDADELAWRSKNAFGFELRPQPGSRKACEYDPACGELFADKIEGYDFWGHCNLDCVYGRMGRWLTDQYLADCDIWGNDPGAICGPLSLYRNTPKVNGLYRTVPRWECIFTDSAFHGFDEGEFNGQVQTAAARGEIRFKSSFWQSHDKQPGHHDRPQISIGPNGELIDRVKREEILMFHFNRSRTWPVS